MRQTSLPIAAALLLAAACVAEACDTPVYRYAMYRWEAAPYEVYYFHDADPSEADRQVLTQFEKLAGQAAPRTNVTLHRVDLRGDALKRLPPDVARNWEEREDKSTPAWLTVSPLGGLVSWHAFTPQSIDGMIDSPARQQVARHLAEAKAGVFVVLSGSDKLLTEAAADQVRELIAKLDKGEVPLYRPPTDPTAEPAEVGKADDAPHMAMVTVDRNDPEEQWFVDSLLAVEGDLREIEKPMVFPVYGRARALPPYVGAGITASNLTDAVVFVTGACSCTVKDQNPGVDLLATFDWESAADAMKERFGSEEGNESFGETALLPQLIIPGETGAAPGAANESEEHGTVVDREPDRIAEEPAGPTDVVDGRIVEQSPARTISAEASPEVALVEREHPAKPQAGGELAHAGSESMHAAGNDRTPAAAGDDTRTMIFTLAVGVGLAIVALAAGTFFVFRNE